ncbi:MAG TPA: hypothetical protein VFF59_01085 [Anaerolineae bacterium]|nr:hypothetical protein [Anaerolineae bacterium]
MPTQRAAATADSLSWQYDIPLITNRYILWDVARLLALSLFVVVALTWLISMLIGDPVLLPIEFLALIAGIVVALFLFVALVLFRNRYRARFTLDEKRALFEGVGWGNSGWDRAMKRLLKVLAFFTAQSDPTRLGGAVDIKWRAVRKVSVNSQARVISLSEAWHVVIRLYCPPDIFDQALAHVQQHTGEDS